MFKKVSLLFSLLISIFLFSCNTQNTVLLEEGNNGIMVKKGEVLKIITTNPAYYDFVSNIIGDSDAEVICLLDNKIDEHSFNPTANDIQEIMNSDIFVYGGGDTDAWINNSIQTGIFSNINLVNVMKEFPDMLLEIKHQDLLDDEEHSHTENKVYDEHMWLSLRNADEIVKHLIRLLGDVDKENKDIYFENGTRYLAKLQEVDGLFTKIVSNARKEMVVVADRFPFRYLFNDYNIPYIAAFDTCSAESEVNFDVILKLANAIDDYDLDVAFVIDGGNEDIAMTVFDSTKKRKMKVVRELKTCEYIDRNSPDATKKNFIDSMIHNAYMLEFALDAYSDIDSELDINNEENSTLQDEMEEDTQLVVEE